MTEYLKLYEQCKYFRTPKNYIFKSTSRYSAFLIYFITHFVDRTNSPTIALVPVIR